MLKATLYFLCLSFMIGLCFTEKVKGQVNAADSLTKDIISVQTPEVYELANIILVMRNYNLKPDKLEKDDPYCGEVLAWFKPFASHLLFQKLDFLRKREEGIRNFRMSSYSFTFDKEGKIKKQFRYTPPDSFKKYLQFVQDFSEKSNFREFYANHKAYYETIRRMYSNYYLVAEMQNYMITEFGSIWPPRKFVIVVSGLVAGWNHDTEYLSEHLSHFISLPKEDLYRINQSSQIRQATQISLIFNDMSADFIQPITMKEKGAIKKQFKVKVWIKIGYRGNNLDEFNKFIKDAVYDLFVNKYFPEYADEIILYSNFWHSDHGLRHSQLFSDGLAQLYKNRAPNQRIKDLFPAMIAWCGTQKRQSVPTIVRPRKVPYAKDTIHEFQINFSEPMAYTDKFDVLIYPVHSVDDTLTISTLENNLRWNDTRTTLYFTIPIPEAKYVILTFNKDGTAIPLKSAKGILLETGSWVRVNTAYFYIK